MEEYGLPIGAAEIAEAERLLQVYKSAKAALDERVIENEQWFKLSHWEKFPNRMMEGKPQPSSGWLFNSIINKHADAMDQYPEPLVLPRAADDEQTARTLSSVLPVVLEQCDYEQVYSDTWWRKLKQGTGVKGIFWDPSLRNGLGDIAVRPMDILMLYWEPGVMDIQNSSNLFSLSLENDRTLTARWEQMKGHTGQLIDVARYINDDYNSTEGKSVVVDWYYKKQNAEGKTILHYCKFCNGVLLYASENIPELRERGFYDHGKYPFVFDVMFVEEGSVAGFGYIDAMKGVQASIDRMNQAMDENVLLASKQRFILSDSAGVNEEELMDFSRDIVHASSRLNEDNFRQMQTLGLQAHSISYLNCRINELKEISGNRDLSQGGVSGGVTAASAIAALQEAGSKLSRDHIKSAYRAFTKECYLLVELMKQFYDETRYFRITGQSGQSRFVAFSGQLLRVQPDAEMGGVTLAGHEPIFDIRVSAAKRTTFSRLTQNETAKECYQLGFFAPANAEAALAALEMMDFEGIEKVRETIQKNSAMAQDLLLLQQQLGQLESMLNPVGRQMGGTPEKAEMRTPPAEGGTTGGKIAVPPTPNAAADRARQMVGQR